MAEIADWRGALGEKWARRSSIMERLLGPFGAAAMDRLGDIAGKRVLDLGCGGGASTLALARRGATALGVDVSPDLIRLAAMRRAAAKGGARSAGFLLADAANARFGAPMDALFSQFGAMFFDDPGAAYAHLRRAMAPGGRLSIACWRAPKENEWAMLPLAAAKPHLPPQPPAIRGAPGPFAWSIPEESFAPMLARAGWRRVAWAPVDIEAELGAGMEADHGGDRIAAAIAFAMEIGPLASRLRDAPEAARKKAEAAVAEAIRARAARGRVMAKAAAWVVTAEA
ncbi:MAG: class I SAM-dependent methyltransferase [Pikeienuella sp.]